MKLLQFVLLKILSGTSSPKHFNFRGLWESNIKGMKYHLFRVIGETLLIHEEFEILFVQVESTLNSRPMYALSSDPNDYNPLTPSHFLIGRPLKQYQIRCLTNILIINT